MGGLSWSHVTAEGASPTQSLLFLHGILGGGTNFRTFAKRLAEAHPNWSAVLVDLRMHGDSQGFSAPHTLEQTALDLIALENELPLPVRGVLGHSFGGKVALAYLAKRPTTLTHAFVLDADPGARAPSAPSDFTLRVLDLLERAPALWPQRELFVAHLQHERIDRGIAQWLAMNLEVAPGGFRFKLDLTAIRALLTDYFAQDLWHVLEPPPANVRIRFVLGGQSPACGPATLARLSEVSRASNVDVVTLPQAGHWVHVDDFEGTLQAVSSALR
ncbi:MAG: alpha/beta fold hydrolase [Myxococcaceae bacterium]